MSTLRVVPIASTVIRPEGWDLFEELGFNPYLDDEDFVDDTDILPEFAGRNCYESFHKPNPATSTNQAYLKNTVDEQQHESILEHSSVSFYISGVSRNLLLELERHRHISFSVISTRYVSPDKMGMVLHPNTPADIEEEIRLHDEAGRRLAYKIYLRSKVNGLGVKESREAARQVLGGNTETKFIVTGNLRAWRGIIQLRAHPKADAEIQQFAKAILYKLKKIAPNSFQNM